MSEDDTRQRTEGEAPEPGPAPSGAGGNGDTPPLPPPPPAAMPGTLALANEGFRRIEEKLGPLLVSLVIGLVAATPLMFAAIPFEGEGALLAATSTEWILLAAAMIWMLLLGFFNNVAVVYLFANQSQPIAYLEAFSWAVRNVVPLAWIGILTSLVMVTATAAFVIPGLILSVYLLFSTIVYMKEGERGSAALIRSTDLVYGAFWPLVLRLILLFLLLFAAVLVFGMIFALAGYVIGETGDVLAEFLSTVVQLVAGWLGVAVFIQLYEHRSQKKPLFVLSEHRNLSLLYKVMAGVGVLIPLLFAAAMLSFFLTMGGMPNSSEEGMSDAQYRAFYEQLEQEAQRQLRESETPPEELQRTTEEGNVIQN